MVSVMSLNNTMNNKGPGIDPFGTRENSACSSETQLL